MLDDTKRFFTQYHHFLRSSVVTTLIVKRTAVESVGLKGKTIALVRDLNKVPR